MNFFFFPFQVSNVTVWPLDDINFLGSVYHHVTYLNFNVMTYFLFVKFTKYLELYVRTDIAQSTVHVNLWHRAPVYKDRRFTTLHRTLFYLFNQQIYFII